MGHGESQIGYLANDINCNRGYAAVVSTPPSPSCGLSAWLKLIVAKTRYHKTSCYIFPRSNSVLNERLIASQYDNPAVVVILRSVMTRDGWTLDHSTLETTCTMAVECVPEDMVTDFWCLRAAPRPDADAP